jgi:hypothetical protein
MKIRHRPMVVGLALATGLGGLAMAATHALASDPPVVLSPTAGPAGTAISVTLPTACKVLNKPGFSGGLSLSFSSVAGGAGSSYQSYPLSPGQRAKRVTFPVPGDAPHGHFKLSGQCYVIKPHGYTFVNYGAAFFNVTGGAPLPPLTVTPRSGPAGTVVKVSGKCAPATGEPTAFFDAVLFSATDPNTSVSNGASGVGPRLHTRLKIPKTFAPGSYFVAASCFDYENFSSYQEQPFTVTAAAVARVRGALVHR